MSEEEGLTAWEALKRICGEVAEEHCPSGTITWVDAAAPEVWAPLYEALEVGTWYAEGFREPDKPERIEAFRWRYLRLDPEDDIAEGGGLRYSGLRFFEIEPPSPTWKTDVDAAYVEHIKEAFRKPDGGPPSIEDDEGWRTRQRPIIPRKRMRKLRRVHNTASLTKPPS